MITSLNYVKWIQKNKITIFCEDKTRIIFLKKLGAKRKFTDRRIWFINCKDEEDLANKLQILNEDGLMFAGGAYGWNPIDIFILMRDKKLVFGEVTEIVWGGSNKILTRIL